MLSFVTGVGIFTTIYLTPLFLDYVRGFSAWQTGTAIFSTGVASLIGTPVYILLARRFDTRWLMMFGLACFALSMWSFSFITHDWGAAELLVPQVLRGFPQVFAVAPSVTLGLGSLPPERLKYASGLFNMMRNLGGAVGIAASAAIVNDQTNLHFQHIAGHLTPANLPMDRFVNGMTGRYAALPGGPARRAPGRAGAALAPGLPRGFDPGLRGCFPGDHAGLRGGDPAGAVPAQGGGCRRPRRRMRIEVRRDPGDGGERCSVFSAERHACLLSYLRKSSFRLCVASRLRHPRPQPAAAPRLIPRPNRISNTSCSPSRTAVRAHQPPSPPPQPIGGRHAGCGPRRTIRRSRRSRHAHSSP